MSDDIGLWLFRLYPAVPHHLMGIIGILRDAHGVGDTTRTIVRLATMVGVRIREDNLHATRRDARASTRALQPVVVPAAHHLDGKLVHVVIVFLGGFTAIQRSLTLFMIGIGIVVPVLAQSFVAAVFHRPHRVFLRLVDVKHLTAILRLVDIKHLARANGTTAIGIIRIANGFHLQHVLTADALVTTLVEKYRRIVAVVDDGIAHECLALFPAGPRHVLLSIARRHGLDQADTVTTLNVLLPRGDVHPAHDVTTRLHHQVVGIVAEPGWHGESCPRPLIRGALGIAVYHQTTVVEPYLALAETRLAETGTDDDLIIPCIKV